MRTNSDHGFTLLEVTLALFLIGIIVVMTINLFTSYQADQFLNITAEEMKRGIKEARENASLGMNASKHGVFFDPANGTYTIYAGESYDERDPEFDVEYSWRHTVVSYAGPSEVIFSPLKATTTATTITLTNTMGKERAIHINEAGRIQ